MPLPTAVLDAESPVRPRGARRRTMLFYGLGSVAYGVKDNGFQVLLLLFYNQVMGLDPRLAGLAIAIALVVDAAVDPAVGYLSDRLRSPLGRRHPFMYAAALPVSLSYLLLFSPPQGLGQAQLFAFLLATAIFVRVCISFYEIPSSALVAELTSGYDERTTYLSLRYFFGWTGGLGMSVLAFSVFLRQQAGEPGFFALQGYRHYGWAAAAMMLASIVASSLGTQAAARPAEAHAARTAPPRSLLDELRATLRTRSAAAATLAGMLLLLATGLTFALGTYFNIYAWQLSGGQISLLTGGLFVSAGLALFAAPWAARRFDKRGAAVRTVALMLALLPAPLALSLAGLMPTMESGWLMPALFGYNVAVTMLFIVTPILFSSMLADVVEEIEVGTGRRAEGMIFAVNTFVQKCATALGVLGSTAILSLARFPSPAVPGQVDPAVITRLSELYIAALALLYLGGLGCIALYRITPERHAANLRTLAERRAAAAPAL